MREPPSDQHGFAVRFDWGARGCRDAAERGDAVVIVDVLRFSSAVATAAARRAVVYPCAFTADETAMARRTGASRLLPPDQHPGVSFVLSPTFLDLDRGERVILRTINGAECTLAAAASPRVIAGSLLNASAAGRWARAQVEAGATVTVVACGELRGVDRVFDFAIEDYLGAGAVLAAAGDGLSPEARVAAAAFVASRGDIEALLMDCGSGRELRAKGLEEDVRHAAQHDLYDAVPMLRDGERYEAM
jgi:2-phosphosulfolactate phosphatase